MKPKKVIKATAKKDDLDDWINKEFSNLTKNTAGNGGAATINEAKPRMGGPKDLQDNSFSREDKIRPFSKTGARNPSPFEKEDKPIFSSSNAEADMRNNENRKFAKPMIAKNVFGEDSTSNKPSMNPARVSNSINMFNAKNPASVKIENEEESKPNTIAKKPFSLNKSIVKPPVANAESNVFDKSENFDVSVGSVSTKIGASQLANTGRQSLQKSTNENTDLKRFQKVEQNESDVLKKTPQITMNENVKAIMKPNFLPKALGERPKDPVVAKPQPQAGPAEKKLPVKATEPAGKALGNTSHGNTSHGNASHGSTSHGNTKRIQSKKEDDDDDYKDDFEDYGNDFEDDEEEEKPPVTKPFSQSKLVNAQKLKETTKNEAFDKPAPQQKESKPDPKEAVTRKNVAQPVEKTYDFTSPALGMKKAQPQPQPQYQTEEIYEKLDERAISIGNNFQEVYVEVSNEKIAQQRKRVADLRNMIQLEVENFDEMLEIIPTTEYELYMSRIKSGTLKNSADQADDDKVDRDIQTEPTVFYTAGNQCPDDRFKTQSTKKEYDFGEEEYFVPEDTAKFINFLNNACPKIEEILALSDQNYKILRKKQDVPIELSNKGHLASLIQDASTTCIYTTTEDPIQKFASYSVIFESMKLAFIVEFKGSGEPFRYFVTQSDITAMLKTDHVLVAGTKDGSLHLWDLRESDQYHRRCHNQIITKITHGLPEDLKQQIVLRYPSFSTEYYSISDEVHSSKIIKIIENTEKKAVTELVSMEEFGKLVFWNISEFSYTEANRNYIDYGMNSRVKLVKTLYLNLLDLFPTSSLMMFDLVFDNKDNCIFMTTNMGILKVDKYGGQNVKPPSNYSSEIDQAFPLCAFVTNTDLFFAGYSDGSLRVFSKSFSKPSFSIQDFSSKPLISIQVLYLDLKVKETKKRIKYEDFTKVIAVNSEGSVFIFNFAQSMAAPIEVIALGKEIPSSKIKKVYVGNVSTTTQLKIDIQTETSAWETTVSLGKYIDKDVKKIKKNVGDLLRLTAIDCQE